MVGLALVVETVEQLKAAAHMVEHFQLLADPPSSAD